MTKTGDAKPKREIAISESDWRWATWRKPTTTSPKSPTPAAKSDDPEAYKDHFFERLSKNVRAINRGYQWDYSDAGLSASMTKDEARLWIECMLTTSRGMTPKQKATELAKNNLEVSALPIEELRHAISQRADPQTPHFALCVSRLFSPMEAIDLYFDSPRISAGSAFFDGLRMHVIDALDDAERKKLVDRVAPNMTQSGFIGQNVSPPKEVVFGTLLGGFHTEIEALVEALPDDRYGANEWEDNHQSPQLLVFGLGSADLVNKQMRRLKLRLTQQRYIRAWLAHTEYSQLDWAAKAVLDAPSKDNAAELAEILALVRAPENAGPMLEIATRSKSGKIGAEWIENNVEHAVAGFIDIVATGRGALAEAASSRLMDLKRAGHGDLIDAYAKSSKKGNAVEKLAALDAKAPKLSQIKDVPSWLDGCLKEAQSIKDVTWLSIGTLPPLEVRDDVEESEGESGQCLGPDHVKLLINALSASSGATGKLHSLVAAIRKHSPEASRDAFVWRIFEEWITAGASSKEKWALMALGLLGADTSALKLAPMIRAWPGESQHQRAVLGLDVLGAIGTDLALVQLSGIAQKVKFQALKRRAGEAMEKIAAARKMSRDELEDRIVPDGGLGEDGKRVLSFGSRSFEVVLGAEGAPMVKDQDGKRRADLPKPNKNDDATVAAQAVSEWKTLKKGLREATKIQIERLEQAMVKGRSWKPKDFDTLLARHPLMSHLTRTLVWSAWVGGKLHKTFRISEDGTAADEKDASYKIPKDAEVRIVHPLEIDEATRAAWGNVFGDYEIIAPFLQLDRPVHKLETGEKTLDDLGGRFKGQEWGVAAFIGKLRRRGWIHGYPQDAGFIYDHHKPFFSAGVTAIIEQSGYPIGSLEYADPQKIEHLYFLTGTGAPGYDDRKRRLTLEKVDAKAVSEVLYDLM